MSQRDGDDSVHNTESDQEREDDLGVKTVRSTLGHQRLIVK